LTFGQSVQYKSYGKYSKARRLDPGVALLARACSCVARVRWHARVCRVAALIRPCPAHLLATEVWTKLPSVSPPRAAMPLLPHCALRQISARSLCRHTEPSPPSPFAQVRVASTRCTAIKGGHLCISSAPALCPPPVSHCCHFRPCFRDRLTIARPNQPPPFFLGRSRSTHPLRRSSPRHGWLPRPQEPPGTAAAHR
jgi:hypothetical protein